MPATTPEPAEPAAAPEPAASPPAEQGLDGVIAVWPAVLDALRGDNMVLATALSHGRPIALDGRELTVAFPEADSFKRRKAESESIAVGAAVSQMAGTPLRMRFELRDLPEPTGEDGAPVPPPTGDELVARLVSEFDAEEILPDTQEEQQR